jgi:hypothetical protein
MNFTSFKTKIHVIDDEPQIRYLLKITQEDNEYDVDSDENAKSGLQHGASIPESFHSSDKEED